MVERLRGESIRLFNDSGEEIQRTDLKLSNPNFGYIDKNGLLQVKWRKEDDLCDSNGFDKQNREENGFYIQTVLLQRGTMLERYGTEGGRFTTDMGTDYRLLALPYDRKTIEFHKYRVVSEALPVRCFVAKGRTAAMFDSQGGAVQYMHEQKIALEIEDGKLEEVFSWM